MGVQILPSYGHIRDGKLRDPHPAKLAIAATPDHVVTHEYCQESRSIAQPAPGLYLIVGGSRHARIGVPLIGEWQASIGPTGIADGVTVAAYLLAAALSVRAARRAWLGRERRERFFWHTLTGLLVFLGINEFLDLQTLLTISGRDFAKSAYWHDARRTVQYMFVLGLTAFAAAAGLAMFWLTRRADVAVRLALVGLVFIGIFVLLRAASFHHLGELFGGGAAQFNGASVQEIAGIVIIAWAAALYPRQAR